MSRANMALPTRYQEFLLQRVARSHSAGRRLLLREATDTVVTPARAKGHTSSIDTRHRRSHRQRPKTVTQSQRSVTGMWQCPMRWLLRERGDGMVARCGVVLRESERAAHTHIHTRVCVCVRTDHA